ncbi:hypothetical protein P691DRAFT_776280 [Macrolepiota fuliginosa MF-IS2]|uniref:Uncharacterized protein n=1 Tax=Macrolepiota fuliginosa MF-IS2 TaxID=1400762 RepID=A0A9P6C121_9AGAR|nr:hypothetical protein P691DRAFT_776280 [Macrolepiota fuliginosa MF-IS2]
MNIPVNINWRRVAGITLIFIGSVVLVIEGWPVILTTLGFTTNGVAAGSIAAAAQSFFYGGATTGLFSALQSAGALAAAPVIGHILLGAGLFGAGTAASV